LDKLKKLVTRQTHSHTYSVPNLKSSKLPGALYSTLDEKVVPKGRLLIIFSYKTNLTKCTEIIKYPKLGKNRENCAIKRNIIH